MKTCRNKLLWRGLALLCITPHPIFLYWIKYVHAKAASQTLHSNFEFCLWFTLSWNYNKTLQTHQSLGGLLYDRAVTSRSDCIHDLRLSEQTALEIVDQGAVSLRYRSSFLSTKYTSLRANLPPKSFSGTQFTNRGTLGLFHLSGSYIYIAI